MASLPPDVTDRFDVLFFDPRGVGRSSDRDCETAAAEFGDEDPTSDLAARRFVEACLTEAGVAAEDVDRYRTTAVVDDLEALREVVGADRLAIIAESYGTELAQAYAIAHPDRVSHLVLDAPVDPDASPAEFWASAATGFSEVLDQVFEECRDDIDCRFDLPEPDAFLDELLADLDRVPRRAAYIDAQGDRTRVTLDRRSVEAAIVAWSYDEVGRMLLLRAIAAVRADDDGPLAKLVDGVGVSAFDSTFSEFTYLAVTCGDARSHPDAGNRAAAVHGDAESRDVESLTLGSVYWIELVCAHWPEAPESDRRPSLTGSTPFPVLVLTATADPITRSPGAHAIAGRLDRANVVETRGGGHGSFALGDPCVDDVVVDLLVDDRRPSDDVVDCEGTVMITYFGLTPDNAADYADALDAMGSADIEIYVSPEYLTWGGTRVLDLGCRFGGSVTITPKVAGPDGLAFEDCVWARGLRLDGTGWIDGITGAVEFDVRTNRGDVHYTYDERGNRTATGRWDGEPVDLED
jgi:pimeloyl-ACP methyl ester carboxylesterase